MAGHVQKQPSSQKQWTKPDKSEREAGYLKRVEEKKKEKPKTAPAGGGMKPPNKPPKGPTGGDNKGPKNPYNPKDIGKGKEPDYNPHSNKPKPKKPEPQSPKNPKGRQFEDSKDLQRNREGQKPHDYKKPDVKITRDQQGHDSSMGGLRKSTKKDK
jgi:hypothetical protein